MWRVCIENPFLNCEKIYPIQQKGVKELVDSLSAYQEVQKIIVFGSSVSGSCHMGSDIDVYVVLDRDIRIRHEVTDYVVDKWTNFSVDGRLEKEILKTGVLVYERKNAANQSL